MILSFRTKVWANCVDQGAVRSRSTLFAILLHFLDALLFGKTTLFFGCPNFSHHYYVKGQAVPLGQFPTAQAKILFYAFVNYKQIQAEIMIIFFHGGTRIYCGFLVCGLDKMLILAYFYQCLIHIMYFT